MAEIDKELQQQLRALQLYPRSPEAQAFAGMEPDLRRELTSRLAQPGTKPWDSIITEYNRTKASRQSQKEENAGLDARIQQALKGQPPEILARVAGLRDPDKINQVIREYNAEKEAAAMRTGAITAGSTVTGFGTGILGAKYADKLSNARIESEMKARGGAISDTAKSLRAIPQSGVSEEALRAQYGDVVKGLRTSRPVPWGAYGTGATLLGLGAYSTLDRAPNAKSDAERAIWTGTGYGEGLAGGKSFWDTVRRHQNPEVAYPQADLGAVNAARRMSQGGVMSPIPPPANAPPALPPGAPQQPPQAPFSPGGADLRQQRVDTLSEMTKTQLQEMAKKRGLPVSGNKPDIAGRLADHMERTATTAEASTAGAPATPKGGSKLPSILGWGGAGLAGATAFDAARNQAKAEGLSPEEANLQGLKSGAIAGGTTAGTYYGATKGIDYAARKLAEHAAGRALLRMIPYAGWGMAAYDLATSDVHGNEGPNGEIMPVGPREFDKQRADAERLRADPALVEERRRRAAALQAPLFVPHPQQQQQYEPILPAWGN